MRRKRATRPRAFLLRSTPSSGSLASPLWPALWRSHGGALGHALTPCRATDSGRQLARSERFDKIRLPLARHRQHPHLRIAPLWIAKADLAQRTFASICPSCPASSAIDCHQMGLVTGIADVAEVWGMEDHKTVRTVGLVLASKIVSQRWELRKS